MKKYFVKLFYIQMCIVKFGRYVKVKILKSMKNVI